MDKLLNDEQISGVLKQYIRTSADRFDRLEEKLDRLTDTVVALARAEEKLVALEQSRQRMEAQQLEYRHSLEKITETVRDTEKTLDAFKKAVWVLFSALVAVVSKIFFGI